MGSQAKLNDRLERMKGLVEQLQAVHETYVAEKCSRAVFDWLTSKSGGCKILAALKRWRSESALLQREAGMMGCQYIAWATKPVPTRRN